MTSTRSAADTGLPAPRVLDPHTFPDLYGLSVTGDCMAPNFPHGANVKVSKTDPYAVGDVVAVWLRPELVKSGGTPAMIKRIAMMPPPWVTSFPYQDHPQSEVFALLMLETNDRPNELLRVRCTAIDAVHKVLGILKPEETGSDYRDEMEESVLRAERSRRRLARGRLRKVAGTEARS